MKIRRVGLVRAGNRQSGDTCQPHAPVFPPLKQLVSRKRLDDADPCLLISPDRTGLLYMGIEEDDVQRLEF